MPYVVQNSKGYGDLAPRFAAAPRLHRNRRVRPTFAPHILEALGMPRRRIPPPDCPRLAGLGEAPHVEATFQAPDGTELTYKTPFTIRWPQKIVLDLSPTEQVVLIDERGSGWMTEGSWHNWVDRGKHQSGYNQEANLFLNRAYELEKLAKAEALKKHEAKLEEEERQRELEEEKKRQADAAAKIEEAKRQRLLEAEMEAEKEFKALQQQFSIDPQLEGLKEKLIAGEITQEQYDAEKKRIEEEHQANLDKLKQELLDKFVNQIESDIQKRLEARAEPLQDAKDLVGILETQLQQTPPEPKVRYEMDAPQRKVIVWYDDEGNVTRRETLVDERGSGWMPEAGWPEWNRRRREGSSAEQRFKSEYNQQAQAMMLDVEEARIKHEEFVEKQIQSLKDRIEAARKAVRTLQLPRMLTEGEKIALEDLLDVAITDPPELTQPDIWYIRDTPEEKIIVTPAGRYVLWNKEDSGWMTEGDWHNWWGYIRNHDYRRGKVHQLGYNARAKAIMDGLSEEKAEEQAHQVFEQADEAYDEEMENKGVQGLINKTKDFINENKGEILAALGVIALAIPVIGVVVGGLLTYAGKKVTDAEKERISRRIAEKRKADLERLKNQLDAGEITKAQYEAAVTKIAEEEAPAILAEMREEEIVDNVMERPDVQEELARERKKKIAIAVGGSAIGLSAITAIVWAIL